MESTIESTRTRKPWGWFDTFVWNHSGITVKILHVKQGSSISYQSHEHRAEYWHVIGGYGQVVIDDKPCSARKGDEFRFGAGAKHRLVAEPDSYIEVLEVAEGRFDENDLTRYEDQYGRM